MSHLSNSNLSRFNHDLRGLKGGPKLVFLHGLMGSWTNWRKILPAFEAEYEILSFDQRGHGKSLRPEPGVEMNFGPEDFADDLERILEELKWTRINLVGHSMGGRNALVFAARHPEMVEKLVIEDIGPEGSAAAIAKIEAILGKVPTPFSDKRLAKETILGAFADQVLANYLYSNIAEVSPGVFDWRFSKPAVLQALQLGHSVPRWTEWKSLKMPILLLRGERSAEFSQDLFEHMLATNPHARGEVIANSGHWIHFDQPQAFIKAAANFLSGGESNNPSIEGVPSES